MAQLQAMSEADMIRQAQNGSQDAYRRLYERYTDAIYRYIYKRVGDSCDAEDLTQTVFVKAWQALRDYQLSGAPFQAWLYRIAHNAVVDHYRTQRDPLLWEDLVWMADPGCTPENRALHAERQAAVHSALAELRPAYRDILVRRFLYNMDYAETAAELGQQVNNVRVLQHRALEALRRVLSAENALRLTTVLAVLTLLLGGKIVVAAEQALPGDSLYPVRTLSEDVRLLLADDRDDLRLHTEFAEQRLTDLATLAAQQRTADLVTAVGDLTTDIRAASATFTALTKTQPADREAVMTQLGAALQRQAADLRSLATSASPEVRAAIQPAMAVFNEAQAELDGDKTQPAVPATAEPTSTIAPQQSPAETSAAPTPWPTQSQAALVERVQIAAAIAVDQNPTRQPSTASDERAPDPVLLPMPTATEPPGAPAEAAARSAGSGNGPTPSPEQEAAPQSTTDQAATGEQTPPQPQANSGQNRPAQQPADGQPVEPGSGVQTNMAQADPNRGVNDSAASPTRPDQQEQPTPKGASDTQVKQAEQPSQPEPGVEPPADDRPAAAQSNREQDRATKSADQENPPRQR